jgi:hypothetical protein
VSDEGCLLIRNRGEFTVNKTALRTLSVGFSCLVIGFMLSRVPAFSRSPHPDYRITTPTSLAHFLAAKDKYFHVHVEDGLNTVFLSSGSHSVDEMHSMLSNPHNKATWKGIVRITCIVPNISPCTGSFILNKNIQLYGDPEIIKMIADLVPPEDGQ